MPLFGKSDSPSDNPQIREIEKRVSREAHADEKNLQHAINDLSTADKAHNKSIKAADKARHALDKSVEKEHKAAKALNHAAHNHDATVSDEQNAQKTVQIQQQHEARLAQDLELKRQHLEELRQRKDNNDQVREAKLAELHEQAAAVAGVCQSFDERALAPNSGDPSGGAKAAPTEADRSDGAPVEAL